jgi:hypothetical protein
VAHKVRGIVLGSFCVETAYYDPEMTVHAIV